MPLMAPSGTTTPSKDTFRLTPWLSLNWDVGSRSVASEALRGPGIFIDTGDLIRLWAGPQRVFLVVRRPRGQSVVAALPAAHVHEIGRYGSRWLYSNR